MFLDGVRKLRVFATARLDPKSASAVPTRSAAIVAIGRRSSKGGPYRGWKKSAIPTNVIAAPAIVIKVEEPAMKTVITPTITSGKPAPSAGPAAHGELFSGK